MSVTTERRGPVMILTIDRPDARNAINADVSNGLESGIDAAEADDSVRAVVITGSGDKAFSAGADLKEAGAGGAGIVTDNGGFAGMVRKRPTTVLIAAVNGSALGGGLEIALACDMVVAADHAVFGIPEVQRGLIAVAGGVFRLAQRLPKAIAVELGVTGNPIDAQRAYDLGLVNRIVPRERLLDAAVELGTQVADAAPRAAALTRQFMLDAPGMDEDACWERSDELTAIVMSSDEMIEGVTAFAEKRDPIWKSR